jgi:hypothetical protein
MKIRQALRDPRTFDLDLIEAMELGLDRDRGRPLLRTWPR